MSRVLVNGQGKAYLANGDALTIDGSGTVVNPLNVTENGTYTAPAGTAYSPVTVNVPGIVPSGAINITDNGTYDVSSKASAVVNVPGIVPSGSINITQNGTYDVSSKASAVVNVPGGSGLPDTYQQLLYIQVEDGQVVTLAEELAIVNPRFDVIFEPDVVYFWGPFLIGSTSAQLRFSIRTYDGMHISANGTDTSFGYTATSGNIYRVSFLPGETSAKMTTYNATRTTSSVNVGPTREAEKLFLFTEWDEGGSPTKFSGRFFGCRIWDGSTLLFNLVPAYNKQNPSEAVIYDTVNNHAYYPDNGTTFKLTSDVMW